MTEFVQVITTVAKEEDGRRLAEQLVEGRLAACVQIVGPITSVYRWQGKIEAEGECQLFIKTRHDLYGELEAWLTANHPYEVPEILALPVISGGKAYLEWLQEELKKLKLLKGLKNKCRQ